MTEPFQFAAQFQVVIDFAIEYDRGVAVRRGHRLIAQRQIDDLQPGRGQRHVRCFEYGLTVGSAVDERGGRAANAAGVRPERSMGKSRNAAHFIFWLPNQ